MNNELNNAPLTDAEILAQLDAEQQSRSATSSKSVLMPMTILTLVVALAVPFAVSKVRASREAAFAAMPKEIYWNYDFEAAQKKAVAEGKPMMIDFYTDWCPACKNMDKYVYPQGGIVAEAQKFVPVKINAEGRTDLADRYKITAFPTIVWTDSAGNEKYRCNTLDAPEFYDAMRFSE